jgi:hypothetical protein
LQFGQECQLAKRKYALKRMATDLIERKTVLEEKKTPREVVLQVMCSFAALCMSMSAK